MKPKISSIQCVSAFVTDISTKANLKFDQKKDSALNYDNLDIDSKLLPALGEDKPRQVSLKVVHDAQAEENAPYSFSIEVVGFFQCQNVPKKDLERFIEIQASSVLYGMARDALLDVMTKGPWNSVFLPLVSFYQNGKILETSEKPEKPEKKAIKRATKKVAKKKKTNSPHP